MDEEKVSISVQIPKAKNEELSKLAKQTGMLKSNLVRNWIFKGLEASNENN